MIDGWMGSGTPHEIGRREARGERGLEGRLLLFYGKGEEKG